MRKERLPRKKKKQSRIVSKWLAAHPEYRPRPVDIHTNRFNIQTYDVHPKKFSTYVRKSVEFCERCPDAMERIKHELAEGFVEVIERHMDMQEVTDNYDQMQYKRRFVATLSVVD